MTKPGRARSVWHDGGRDLVCSVQQGQRVVDGVSKALSVWPLGDHPDSLQHGEQGTGQCLRVLVRAEFTLSLGPEQGTNDGRFEAVEPGVNPSGGEFILQLT